MTTALILAALLSAALLAPRTPPALELRVFGLELAVGDVDAAAARYAAGLDFHVVLAGGEVALLERNGLTLVLVRASGPAPAPGGGPLLSLGAAPGADFEETVARLLEAGFALGPAGADDARVALVDPDGYALELGAGASGVHVAALALGPETTPDLRRELERLLPALAPRDAPAPSVRAARLLLAVPALGPALAELGARGLVAPDLVPRPSPVGQRVPLRLPGLAVELVERSPAQLAFERLRALAGSWEGRSSAGWTARAEIEVIARGTVVLERTNFEAHPGETMLTLFHRDGAELVLTHYCVAGNQPRLVASGIDGDALHFTFRDATNLPTPAQGHMGEARFRLGSAEAFSSVWSFRRGAQTSWMEEIQYRRIAAARSADAALEAASTGGHSH